ncbi:MAG: malate/lactate/ureidoglycolate dehydrogenase, partial [Rhodospirillaceae bacterium]|nr:malate/lactate/ureidoglycolate dehydrogenase [Rhodospirillaceae bacterium]
RDLVAGILQQAGAPGGEARRVADHLVEANLVGHDSHGVQLLHRYVDQIAHGTCVPGTRATCINDAGAILQFDGGRGFGICVGAEAMHKAMERCKTTGVVLMTLRNAAHIGRVGAYAELALAQNLISIHFVNVVDHKPMVAPFMGRDARFGTNPMCIGIPGGATAKPFLLDMATSAIAMGKVMVAHQSGQKLQDNAIIDSDGHASNDPAAYIGPPQGALLPFGLHKGYGLMLACELLAGAMTGYGTIQPGTPRRGGIINNMFSFIVDPARLGDQGQIRAEVDALAAYLKGAPTAGPEQVVIAGEPEAKARAERLKAGIFLPPGTLAELKTAGEKVGLGHDALKALKTP